MWNLYCKTIAQRKEAAKEILDAQIARDIKMYGREAAAHWTQDNIDNELAALEKSLGSTSKSKQIADYSRQPYGQQKVEDAANRRKIFIQEGMQPKAPSKN